MGCLMLVLSPTRRNPKSVDLALSMAQSSKRALLAVFIIDTKVADAISGHIVNIGFLGDKVSDQLKATILKEYEARGKRELEDVKERAEGLGIKCRTMVGKGGFVEVCLRIADDEKVDDIVVSRAERSKISRKIFGSAVNELLERATCPVLVVSDSTVENHADSGG